MGQNEFIARDTNNQQSLGMFLGQDLQSLIVSTKFFWIPQFKTLSVFPDNPMINTSSKYIHFHKKQF